MRKFITIMAVVAVALLCCQCTTSKELRQAKKGAKEVPFTELKNYYVRNNMRYDRPQHIIIDNQQDFDAYFGAAAVMGGLPTDVNWNKQYVIAVILPVTNHATMVTPLEVKQSPGNVIFKYQVYRGGKTSYTLMPFAAVALNKGVDPQQIQVFFIEK